MVIIVFCLIFFLKIQRYILSLSNTERMPINFPLMKLLPTKYLIIITVLTLVVISFWVWFFVFRTTEPASENPVAPAPVAESNDDIRIRHLELIKKSIQTTLARGVALPLPEDAVTITFGEDTLLHQGKAGLAFFNTLWLNVLLDPKTGAQYEYALSADGTKYQVIATLDKNNTGSMIYSVGEEAFMMRNKAGEIITRTWVGVSTLDISDSEARKKLWLSPLKSCQEIFTFKNTFSLPKSGVYSIDIDGRETKVFCDMQTDGGGWTLFYANNSHEDSPIQKSYVQMRETMSSEPVLDLSNYDDSNLAWLLDYNNFIDTGSKEILIRNRAGDEKKWVKFTFSIPRALKWALWPAVLGKTENGCLNMPYWSTWSINNDDKKISYENLTQMMNHSGTSWGVSHEKYLCNNLEKWVNPHIGFYSASDSKFNNRSRSNEGIAGKWWWENEYRYFIR